MNFTRLLKLFTPPTKERKIELRKQDEGILWPLIYLLAPGPGAILYMWTRRTLTPLLTYLAAVIVLIPVLGSTDLFRSLDPRQIALSYKVVYWIAIIPGSYIGFKWDVSRAKSNSL